MRCNDLLTLARRATKKEQMSEVSNSVSPTTRKPASTLKAEGSYAP